MSGWASKWGWSTVLGQHGVRSTRLGLCALKLCVRLCVLCGGAYGHAVEDARGLKCAEGVSESERERGGDGVGQRKRNEPKWQCAHKNNQRPPKGWGEIARLMAGPRSSGWLAGSRATGV
jgi:hypothetical protein